MTDASSSDLPDIPAGGQSAQAAWDERYAAPDRVWSAHPNMFVEHICAAMPPGRALDVGAGEGRHAIWLAHLGWTVEAFDISSVGMERGQREAGDEAPRITWTAGDVTVDYPNHTDNDLVLAAYLHLPLDTMREVVMPRMRLWVRPGGDFVLVAHARENLEHGVGGPQDPDLLPTEDDMRAFAGDFDVLLCATRTRPTEDGDAIDLVLHARAAE